MVALSPLTFEIDIANEFRVTGFFVCDACDAHIDDACFWLHHIGRDESRHASCRNDDVSTLAKLFQLFGRCEAMAHCHRCVHSSRFVASVGMQKHENRQTDVLWTTNDDDIFAECIDVWTFDELLHAQCCARNQRINVQTQATHIFLIESIHVFVAADRIADDAFVDVRWHRQLNQNPVDVIVWIQFIDDAQQFQFGYGRRKSSRFTRNAYIGSSLQSTMQNK